MEITIYRDDFKEHADDHSSLFEVILQELRIPKKDWDNINEVTLDYESFHTE